MARRYATLSGAMFVLYMGIRHLNAPTYSAKGVDTMATGASSVSRPLLSAAAVATANLLSQPVLEG